MSGITFNWEVPSALHPERVSVIIPCFNQGRFLPDAIKSVLAQTYRDLEVLVMDDGSTDDTGEVASTYPVVRLLQQRNQGVATARNAALRESTGGYLVFLDADDRLLPYALDVGIDALAARPSCAFAAGHCRFIGPDGTVLPTPPQRMVQSDHYRQLLRRNYIWNPGSVMYRRTVFETTVGFRTCVGPTADYDLYLRISKDRPVYCHSTIVAEYRRHEAAMTCNASAMLKAERAVLQSQWGHIKKDRLSRDAYKVAIRQSQTHYAGELLQHISTVVPAGEWRAASDSLSLLLRYCAPGVVRQMTGRIKQTLRAALLNPTGHATE